MSRRELLAGGVVLTAGESPAAGAGTGQNDEVLLRGILKEAQGIHAALGPQGAVAVARIRESRKLFLRNTGKFPEFVDVGLDVFEATIDWLLWLRQPVSVTQMPDGRYSLPLLGTTVVLRPDHPDNYVGQGYEK